MRRSERACGKRNRASCFGTVLGHSHTHTHSYTDGGLYCNTDYTLFNTTVDFWEGIRMCEFVWVRRFGCVWTQCWCPDIITRVPTGWVFDHILAKSVGQDTKKKVILALFCLRVLYHTFQSWIIKKFNASLEDLRSRMCFKLILLSEHKIKAYN